MASTKPMKELGKHRFMEKTQKKSARETPALFKEANTEN
jgi:hypothetical protein